MTALDDEFSAAVCSITPERFATLRAAGVPSVSPPLVGMAPIETHAAGLFGLMDHGEMAVIVPCGWWDGLNWDLDDLVAFHLDSPGRWWRRVGVADVLGDVDGFTIEPKEVRSTPLDWLKASGKGLVILDWSRDPVDLLLGAGPLVADQIIRSKLRTRAAKDAAACVDGMFSNA